MRRTPRITLLLLLLLAAPACGDNTLGGDGHVAASWSITLGGEPTDCFALAAHDVVLTATPTSGGPDEISVMPCDVGSGTSDPLPVGAYDVTATLAAYDGSPIATAAVGSVDIEADGEVVEVEPLAFDVAAARIAVTWDLQRGDGSAATCLDFDANRFELALAHDVTTAGFAAVFECDAGEGTTGVVPLGSYTTTVGLLTDFDVLTTSSEPFAVTLDRADVTVELEHVVFVLP